MANISFGINQLGKVTPDKARWIPRIYTALAAFVVGFTTNAHILSPFALNVLEQFFIYFAPVVVLVENMFGVTPELGDSVHTTAAEVETK